MPVGSPGSQDRELRLPLGLQVAEWWASHYGCSSGSLSQLLTEEGTALKTLASPGFCLLLGPLRTPLTCRACGYCSETPVSSCQWEATLQGPPAPGCHGLSHTQHHSVSSSAKPTALIPHSALSCKVRSDSQMGPKTTSSWSES